MSVQLYDIWAGNTVCTERFERKYYIPAEKTGMAHGLLLQTCLKDGEYPSEQINSLYFDTADLDQHERSSSGDFRKDKVRIRWYGNIECSGGTQAVFVELKSKQAFAGTKKRLKLTVPCENLRLSNMNKGIIPGTLLADTLAGFGYFPPGKLQPVIKIAYWRYRFNELMTGQRVSLDCRIRSTMVIPGPGNGEKDLELPGSVIEIKGRSMEMPETLKRTRILEMDWTRFSKYSACIDAHNEPPGTVGRLSPSGRLVRL
ncbi:MAG: VTC domain-containing protein [Dehalococcoidales bacterium]|nr:VTC domain-containing protein [Dehalococcoidales bacterium]